MPSQYHLQQRTASALSEICGINDIVETGSNANGWYCKFANGFQLLLFNDTQNFNGNDIIVKDLVAPTTSISGWGNGVGHTSSQPGGGVTLSNFSFSGSANIRITYWPLSTWDGYEHVVYYAAISRWR